MRDLFGNLFRLIVVLVMSYVVARVGFHYYVKDQVKDIANSVAAYAVIDYAMLETDIDGTIELIDVNVAPLGLDQSIRIEKILAMGPSVLEIAREYLPIIGKAHPPAYGRVRVSGISIPLKGELGQYLDELLQGNDGGSVEACGTSGLISTAMASKLGMQMLQADAKANYRYDLKGRRISGDVSFGVRGMQSLSLDYYLANISPSMLTGGQKEIPSIISMAVKFRIDPEYGRKVAAHCAGKNKISIADYKLLLTDQFLRQQRYYGITFGWGLETAVRKFFRDWGEIELALKPDNPINPVGLVLLSADKMLDSLGLELTLNGELITDLSMTIGEAREGAVSNLLLPKVKKKASPKKRRVVYQMVYREVPASDIQRYKNRLVRMLTQEGAVRHGALIDIDGDTAQLDQRQPGGQFSSFVDLDEVEQLEVLFREQVPQVSPTP